MITIAIPNRNGGKYLHETLSSLCSSSNRGFLRWWLQDCCSQDESVRIAAQHRSSNDEIRIEKDSGQANGLNRAFAQMGGEIVGYINSDDCLVDGAAATVCEAFGRDPTVDIVFGSVDWIDKDGCWTGRHHGHIFSLEDALNIYGFWWNNKQWVQPEVFFRRHLYEAVGGFDENFSLAFDFDFWVRVLKRRPKVISIPRTLVRFRRHDQQRSKDFELANEEIRRVVLRELRDPASPLEPRFRTRLSRKLEYDLYHCGSRLSSNCGLPFDRALMQSPRWLLLPEVRKRLVVSIRNRFSVRPNR